jgi:hypothetical protein
VTSFQAETMPQSEDPNQEPGSNIRLQKRDENTIQINTRDGGGGDEHSNSIVGVARHIRLRHAKELLSVDPKKFVYSGLVGI